MSIQDISSDILHLIVKTAAATAAVSLSTEEFELEPVHIKELLGVSRIWRAVAIPIYCSCITICSIADRKSMYWVRKGLPAAKAHGLNWQGFARRAVVVVSGRGASAEEILAELSSLAGIFLRISRVQLHLLAHPESFFGALEKAFPAMRQIKLVAHNAQIFHTRNVPISSLTNICVTACPAFGLSIEPLTNLRVLVLNLLGSNVGDCLAFARKHSATLVSLEINYIHVRDCTSVVLDEQGCETVYKQVEILKLDVLGAYDHAMLQQRTAPVGNPFPSLKYLNCGSVYPFTNDILLRCAQLTLAKLVISIDASVVAWLIPEATSLSRYVRLAAIDAHIVARASVYEQQCTAIHNRILDAAFRLPQLQRLRVR
ncbi:hypothetical protein IWW36_004637, partial [Coemansia brasiliensis]